MPDAQIQNPAGLYGLVATPNVLHVELVNNSAAARTPGDVVVIDVTGTLANTTTTVNDKTVVGVVGARIPTDSTNTQASTGIYAVGAVMPVIIRGPCRINVGANTPALADILTTSATAAVAVTNAGAPAANAVLGSLIAIAMETAKDANNTLRAYIQKF